MDWKILLRQNPFSDWVKWIRLKTTIERKYRNTHVGYYSRIANCEFSSFNYIGEYAVLTDVILGDYSYVGGHSVVHNAIFGKYCSVASGCMIGLGIHPTNHLSTHPVFYTHREPFWHSVTQAPPMKEYEQIVIGHDVWIGTNAIIRDGVKIGTGSIVAAGAVVTHNVPPYAIVGGVPAKIIRYRFDDETIGKLLDLKWWEEPSVNLQQLPTWDIKQIIQLISAKDEYNKGTV